MNNESILDIYSDPKNAVDHWMVELELSRKSLDTWQKKSEKIIKRYKDERGAGVDYGLDFGRQAKFNILWSNVETLKPSITRARLSLKLIADSKIQIQLAAPARNI